MNPFAEIAAALHPRDPGPLAAALAERWAHLGPDARPVLVSAGSPRPEPPRPPEPPPAAILVTEGLGDWFTVESHMTPAERSALRRVVLATRADRHIAAVLAASPTYRGVRCEPLRDGDGMPLKGFHTRAQVAERFGAAAVEGVPDRGIALVFPEIRDGHRHYSGSTFLCEPLADISRFGLPARHLCVQPTSPDDPEPGRDFSAADWAWLIDHLDRTGQSAVIVNAPGAPPAPGHPRVIDLQGETTVPESIEILKGASGFIGIGSSLSVLAAQRFPADRLVIKTGTPFIQHMRWWATTYYAPHPRCPFVRGRLTHEPLGSLGYDWHPHPTCPELEWDRGRGVARQRADADVGPAEYDDAYFGKYLPMADAPIGRALNDHRVALARRYAGQGGAVLDVGIGAGTFLERWAAEGGRAYGWDVNPAGLDWLDARGWKHDPAGGLPAGCRVVTLWDCLEHMAEPGEFLGRLPEGTTVLLSLPIVGDLADLGPWKHRRPGEHLAYWTEAGLRGYLADCGWRVLEWRDDETRAGRADIATVVARKGDAGPAATIPLAESIGLARRWRACPDRDPRGCGCGGKSRCRRGLTPIGRPGDALYPSDCYAHLRAGRCGAG